jgi:hypothetical protein
MWLLCCCCCVCVCVACLLVVMNKIIGNLSEESIEWCRYSEHANYVPEQQAARSTFDSSARTSVLTSCANVSIDCITSATLIYVMQCYSIQKRDVIRITGGVVCNIVC